ncbi:MAG: hypothetical protein HQL61_00620 [Magnetococcales bacterium]|uniref:Uncharacterized protein n=1 Tax=Candidatus Magnetobacterium casense TaxID=1455061 RepID=A0ABS6S280_9BACT|nr:hypothetical protein [Candidatus Magnetobacterium casensis]MBF0606037.1 hypothetical protein [Nitrospirota bacterium]MBV6342528.1 hypothetical protein [Candidatus Magnetobacterium casensis]
MENIINWVVELNRSNHLGFALVTVVTMAGLGALIGSGIELCFKALGVKHNKIEIHH